MILNPTTSDSNSTQTTGGRISIFSGAVVCALSLAIFAGWFTGDSPGNVYQQRFSGTQPAAALCFLLTGIHFLFYRNRRFSILAVIAATTLFSVSLLTIIDYLGTNSWGLRTFLPDGLLQIFDFHPELLPPNTALAFFLAAISLLLVTRNPNATYQHLVAGLSGLLVSAVGLMSILGYLTHVSIGYRWGYSTAMSHSEAFGLLLIGGTAASIAWSKRRRSTLGHPKLLTSILVYSVSAVAIIGILSSIFSILPFFHELKQSYRTKLVHSTIVEAVHLEQYLTKATSFAALISSSDLSDSALPSKSSVDLSVEELMTVSNSIKELLVVRPEVIGFCRAANGPNTSCLISWGRNIKQTALRAPPTLNKPLLIEGPFRLDGELVVIIRSLVESRSRQILGTDYLVVTLKPLLIDLLKNQSNFVQTNSFIGVTNLTTNKLEIVQLALNERKQLQTTIVNDRPGIRDATIKAINGSTGISAPDISNNNVFISAYTPIKGTEIGFVKSVDPSDLDVPALKRFGLVLLGVICLVAIGCAGVFWVVRELTQHVLKLQDEIHARTERLIVELNGRKEAERSLEQQRAFLRLVIDINPNLIFAKDRSGRFTLVNQAVAKAYGTSAAELIGMTDADFNPNVEEVQHFLEDDLRVMDEKVELRVSEELLTDATGRSRWLQTVKRPLVSEDGTCNEILGVATDITEQKKAQEVSSRLAAIVESSEDAIIGLTLQGIVQSWNSGAQRVFGFSAPEIVGRSIFAVVPADRHDEAPEIVSKIHGGEKVEQFETIRVKKDGTLFDASITRSPIFDDDGEIIGVSSIVRDISRMKNIQRELVLHREHLEDLVEERTRELESSQEQVRQAERMASIGVLAAGIAHEINNPVGVIQLTAENAIENVEFVGNTEEAVDLLRRTCDKIVTNASRCSRTVKGVLQFARHGKTERWPNNLNGITQSAVAMTSENAKKNKTRVHLDLANELPSVEVNPLEIEQVIINLINNSIEANSKESAVINIATRKLRDCIEISVEDNGKGIAEDKLRHIFDPFFTTRQNDGGTGLGLSIVHGIVSAHGGKIDVRSAPNKGTSITVSFPLAAEKIEAKLANGQDFNRR